jgi:hypothetical protein
VSRFAPLLLGLVACGPGGELTDPGSVSALRAAIARLPPSIAPARVMVRIDPRAPIDRIETDRERGEIWVTRAFAAEPDPRPWAHELVHLRLLGPRPKGLVASRMIAALEEGVADYVTRVTVSPVEREAGLSTSAHFESLALADLRFDPHPLGAKLDRAIVAEVGESLPIAEALVACFGNVDEAETPKASTEAWLAHCPEGQVAAIRKIVERWLPSELR